MSRRSIWAMCLTDIGAAISFNDQPLKDQYQFVCPNPSLGIWSAWTGWLSPKHPRSDCLSLLGLEDLATESKYQSMARLDDVAIIEPRILKHLKHSAQTVHRGQSRLLACARADLGRAIHGRSTEQRFQ